MPLQLLMTAVSEASTADLVDHLPADQQDLLEYPVMLWTTEGSRGLSHWIVARTSLALEERQGGSGS